ncbi:PREDICTED: VQ motif-containing protein 4-like isoform X2 [Ipomoea nil]|uniref:VQ motif-containing protein 4-like isoform X2 n=1 Tax=Ipomoea nil TaxID=35883 RepID=UPI0009015ECF|nr:PREDICTED: VQ motif-containing protein 4-like isoform X2 [Ipomoea nil]
MEMTSMAPHQSSSSSPNSNGSSIVSTSTISNNNGTLTPPLTPKTLSRSEANNPYPTTFVQADTGTFKQVVQMLTGSSETAKNIASKPSSSSDPSPPPPSSSAAKPFCGGIPPKKEGFKLYKRRNSLKNNNELMISPLIPGGSSAGFSPRKPEILSPSILDFPSLVLSPVTPLTKDPLSSSSEEEKAIAEKKFYLHPSPRANAATTPPGDAHPPQLLPLFPVTSPGPD